MSPDNDVPAYDVIVLGAGARASPARVCSRSATGGRADQASPLSRGHSGPGICCPSGVPHWLRKTTSSTGVRCATAHRPTG